MLSAKEGFAISEMRRVLENMFQFGTVESVNEDGTEARISVDDMTSDFLPILQRRAGKDAEKWCLETGEQVFVVCPSGDLDNGIIVGAIHREGTSPDGNGKVTRFKDGSFVQHYYDEKAKKHNFKAEFKSTDCQIEIKGQKFAFLIDSEGVIKIKGSRIDIESGTPTTENSGVVTGECVCPVTGIPHAPTSQVLRASFLSSPLPGG